MLYFTPEVLSSYNDFIYNHSQPVYVPGGIKQEGEEQEAGGMHGSGSFSLSQKKMDMPLKASLFCHN